MTNNFIEYPNPSPGYPKLITLTILANTAVTDNLKATIFIINIPILSPKSHLLLLYHQICVLNLRRRKLPLSLCARSEDRSCTHCTKINKNLKYNRLLGRAEIHTIQISFVVLCWVVLKHETAPLLDAGATKWAANALHLCGSKHFCQSLFALHTSNTYICICNTRCSVFAVLSILVAMCNVQGLFALHTSHTYICSLADARHSGWWTFQQTRLKAQYFPEGCDCWPEWKIAGKMSSLDKKKLCGAENFPLGGTCAFSIWLHFTTSHNSRWYFQ